MTRYHRIVGIDDFDYFEGWTDVEERAPHSFGIRTVIYGPNGAGKSTLASIFHAVERAQAGDEVDPRLDGIQVELTNGEEITSHRGVSGLPNTIVFSREYVERNLREAFASEDGVGTPLFAVGEGQADLASDIRRATAELEQAEERDEKADKEAAAAERDERKATDRVREDVVEKLSVVDPKTYHINVYKRQAARDLMEEHPEAEPLSPERLRDHLDFLGKDANELASVLDFAELPRIPGALLRELELFIKREVLSDTIERLAQAPPLAAWAQRGLELHSVDDDCGFCGSTVTESRLSALRAHFDDSYRELQSAADSLGTQLDEHSSAVDSASNQLPHLEAEGGTLGRWVTEHRAALRAAVESQSGWLAATREMIESRRRDPLRVADWAVPEAPIDEAWTELAGRVRAENQERQDRVSNISNAKEQASSAVFGHIVASHRSDYGEAREAHEAAGLRAQSAADLVKQLKERLRGLQVRERAGRRDAKKVAENLSGDLARYLGFRGLTVTYDETGDVAGFRFLRHGEPCTGLSEGERGAIALLYFLRRLESDEVVELDAKKNKPVSKLHEYCVVIDDPVSSFDNDTIVTAYTYLRDRFTLEEAKTGVSCAQLIVLTHNFHFMRHWMVDYGAKADQDERRAKKNDEPLISVPSRRVAFLDLRPTLEAGAPPRRVSRLRDLGGSRTGRSEYHLLFEEVCRAYQEADQARLLLAGNAARRMLESFVYWKWPEGTQLGPTVEDLGRHHGIPDDVVNVVCRATNNVSHRIEVGINERQHVGDVSETLRLLLWFMRQCDPDHFERMCAAQNVSTPELGPALTRTQPEVTDPIG